LSYAQTKDNQQLAEIYSEYELDHSSLSADLFIREDRDSVRKIKATAIFENIESPTSNDYANMTVFYGDFGDTKNNQKMIELMEKASHLDYAR
jgi:hypothetical protein